MVTAGPTYWPENHPVPGVVFVDLSPFLPGDDEPQDQLHGEWCACSYTPSQVPESPDGWFPGIGESLDPVAAVGYPDNSPCGDVGPGSENPGISPRCGTDPGGPIHLTTNISVPSPQVSYLHLIEEVCPYSAWKTHWY